MEIITRNEILMFHKIDEIVFFESTRDFTKTHTCDGSEALIFEKMDKIEETLPGEKFFKIHESFIINADYLKKIKVRTSKKALLQNGIEISISQNKYSELIEFLRMNYNIW